MNRRSSFLALIALPLAAGCALAQGAAPAPQGVSIAAAATRLEAEGLRIDEMERERHGITVKAVDRDGRRIRLMLDPATGEVLRREARDGHERR